MGEIDGQREREVKRSWSKRGMKWGRGKDWEKEVESRRRWVEGREKEVGEEGNWKRRKTEGGR